MTYVSRPSPGVFSEIPGFQSEIMSIVKLEKGVSLLGFRSSRVFSSKFGPPEAKKARSKRFYTPPLGEKKATRVLFPQKKSFGTLARHVLERSATFVPVVEQMLRGLVNHHSTRDLRHSTRDLRHSTRDLRHSTRDLRRSALHP